MKFHLVSNEDPHKFIDAIEEAVEGGTTRGHFVQEIKFTTVFSETSPHRQIWSAFIIFGDIPT